MAIFDLTTPIPRRPRGVAIGMFDGVHIGHRELIRRLVERCRELDLIPTVFTFKTHPALSFPGAPPFQGYLMDERDRLETLHSLGVVDIVALPIVSDVVTLEPCDFVQRWLVDILDARLVAVGRDARFGAQNRGDALWLMRWCRAQNIACLVVDDVVLDGEKVSSTRIRRAIGACDMAFANRMMCHPYRLYGTVTHGRRLGGALGCRTINVPLPPDRVPLPHGVYASRVHVDGRWYDAVTNVGCAPTVAPHARMVVVESHLFDVNADLYGRDVRVNLLTFLRPERVHPDTDVLRAQIARDMDEARRALATAERPVILLVRHHVELVVTQTTRFAIGFGSLRARLKVEPKTLAAWALLSGLMMRRTPTYPTTAKLERHLAKLGDAHLSPVLALEGDVLVFGLNVSAPETTSHHALIDSVTLAIEAFLGVLDASDETLTTRLSHEKASLTAYLKSLADDKIETAIAATHDALFPTGVYGRLPYGTLDSIEATTLGDVQAAYTALLNDASLTLYVSGQLESRAIDRLALAMDRLPEAARPDAAHQRPLRTTAMAFGHKRLAGATTEHIVVMALARATAWYESDRYAEHVAMAMLEGEQHAFLFRALREEESLCYQVFAYTESLLDVALIVAATRPEEADQVKRRIHSEWARLAVGDFTDDDLVRAKRDVEHAMISAHDRAVGLFVRMIHWHVYGRPFHIDDRRSFVRAVTRDDVRRVARQQRWLGTLEFSHDERPMVSATAKAATDSLTKEVCHG